MADIQHDTDINQAKARLEEVDRQREGRQAPPSPAGSLIRSNGNLEENHSATDIKASRERKQQKKKFGRKLKEAFFGDIGDGSITEHIFFNIFVPSIKRVLSDMGNTAINMALGLDPKTRTIGGTRTHTANASVYRDRNYNRASAGGSGYSRRDAVCDYTWSEEDAKDIYNQINDVMTHYGYVTLADVYSIMDMGSKIRSTDKDWGWTSMRNVEVYPTDNSGESWVVDMPPARPLQYQ